MVSELIQVFRGTNFLILNILLREFPLSAGAIFKRVKERHKKLVSYQAVHKQVRLLYRLGILGLEGRFFKLNFDWIKERKRFFDLAFKNYDSESTRLEFPV